MTTQKKKRRLSADDIVRNWFNDPRTQRVGFALPRGAYDSLVRLVRRVRREAERLRARLEEVERERDEARAAYRACAEAIGVMYEAEGHASQPGPVDAVVAHIRDAVARSHRCIDAETELERLRAVVEAARVLISRAYPMVLDNEYHVGWRDLEDLRAALAALDADKSEAPDPP